MMGATMASLRPKPVSPPLASGFQMRMRPDQRWLWTSASLDSTIAAAALSGAPRAAPARRCSACSTEVGARPRPGWRVGRETQWGWHGSRARTNLSGGHGALPTAPGTSTSAHFSSQILPSSRTVKLLTWNRSLTPVPFDPENSPLEERKSGIAAAVETPAPATATMRRAPRTLLTTSSNVGPSGSTSAKRVGAREGPASGPSEWGGGRWTREVMVAKKRLGAPGMREREDRRQVPLYL